jgi:hypothetical protein
MSFGTGALRVLKSGLITAEAQSFLNHLPR